MAVNTTSVNQGLGANRSWSNTIFITVLAIFSIGTVLSPGFASFARTTSHSTSSKYRALLRFSQQKDRGQARAQDRICTHALSRHGPNDNWKYVFFFSSRRRHTRFGILRKEENSLSHLMFHLLE